MDEREVPVVETGWHVQVVGAERSAGVCRFHRIRVNHDEGRVAQAVRLLVEPQLRGLDVRDGRQCREPHVRSGPERFVDGLRQRGVRHSPEHLPGRSGTAGEFLPAPPGAGLRFERGAQLREHDAGRVDDGVLSLGPVGAVVEDPGPDDRQQANHGRRDEQAEDEALGGHRREKVAEGDVQDADHADTSGRTVSTSGIEVSPEVSASGSSGSNLMERGS